MDPTDALAQIREAMKAMPCQLEFGFAFSETGTTAAVQVLTKNIRGRWVKVGPFLTTKAGTRSSLLELLALMCAEAEKEEQS